MDWPSVGVDLAGSPKRMSGLCGMDFELRCETGAAREDEEVLVFVEGWGPEVVAIDAPLSTPRQGVLRECDRRLIKMGIRLLPPAMKGMRALTDRGIALKKRLRELGYTVIETYPGGIQDLLGIPRKGRGLDALKEGLIRLGVKGLRCDETGDELDAVTCALAGIAYLKGRYIEVGDPEEGVIILPLPESLKVE